ncbi:MAG: isochorismatase family protein [Alphaproteobacteria bacterium]|jgi:maleamate amidohydrolase|nr:isochorismatase family protein [Alphaproteobacteria bacterium]
MARDFEDHCWKDVVSPEELEIYKHYERDVYVGERPALLMIDLYNFVYRGDPTKYPHELAHEFPNSCGKFAWDAVEPTKKLLAACRAAGMPIIYLSGSKRKNRVQSTNRHIESGVGDDMLDIHPAFAVQDGDIMIRKERASAFHSTPLIAHLTRLGISSLIVCGESTSGCVRASVVDAYSYGYHVTVAEECVFDRSQLTHKMNLFDMHHKYADVMVLEDIVQHLEQTHPAAQAAE